MTSVMPFPRLLAARPALVLAPMEGVTDAPMRALLSERGGFQFCVSEFLRISQEIPPARVYREHIPELAHGCATPSGLPIQLQLLGGDPEKMAIAAHRAWRLGAGAIDLNFGCPAPTVNRHDGGATLLKYPLRIRALVSAIKSAVPADIPVSAKLRLGWDDLHSVHENADRAAEGGADWITIHGRTRVQGYAPPAYWGPIGEVRRRLSLPLVANGDIWTLDDFRRCREQTGCEHFMLGRGAVADPTLPLRIARELGISAPLLPIEDALGETPASWEPLVRCFVKWSFHYPHRSSSHVARRIKQWVRMATLRRELAWFDELKRLESLDEILALLARG